MKKFLALIVVAAQTAACLAQPPGVSPAVQTWLASQTNVHTWSAEVEQTRTLKSLTQPLKASGHVWFEAPGRFRWELGQPAETIAVSTLTNLLIIYPRLKRVEVVELSGDQTGPWKSAMDMLQAGFPRTQEELLSHYNIFSDTVVDGVCRLQLQPKSDLVRRMMPKLEIDIGLRDNSLRGTELQFADGSTMRNDFTNIVLNPTIEASRLSPEIPREYTVVHPQAQTNGR